MVRGVLSPWYGSAFVLLVLVTSSQVSFGQFMTVNPGLSGAAAGSMAWGDFDADGDQDVLLTGLTNVNPGERVASIYRNDGGDRFTDILAGLPGVYGSCAAWGDFDGDDDLDILFTGMLRQNGDKPVSRVYRNDGQGTFTDIHADLIAVGYSSAAWGDFDNDDDLDILIAGTDQNAIPRTDIYRNNGNGTFSMVAANLVGVEYCTASWGDYDHDGDLDIVVSGWDADSRPQSRVYRNDGNGAFSDIDAGLIGVESGSAAWGDYDNDGDLDIVVTGASHGGTPVSRLYRNDGSDVFRDLRADLVALAYSSAAWGDYDADGDLDLLLSGMDSGYLPRSLLYRNDGNDTFTITRTAFRDLGYSSTVWSDYDVDGDLDLIHMGIDGKAPHYAFHTMLYRNDGNYMLYWNGPTGVSHSAAASGDYDNDGDLDVLLTGFTSGIEPVTHVCRNDGASGMTQVLALSGVGFADAAWADFDLDGDLDFLISGQGVNGVHLTEVYRNDGNDQFTDLDAGLTGLAHSAVAWGDHDGDGDPDILISGKPAQSDSPMSAIYRNVGNGAFLLAAFLPGLMQGDVAWRDLDNDGDADVILTGATEEETAESRVFLNNSVGVYTEIATGLVGVQDSSIDCADYDLDGDVDVLLTGRMLGTGPVTRVYRNDGGGAFYDVLADLPGVQFSSAAWGDHDHDGDLDILLTGFDGARAITQVWDNDGGDAFSHRVGLPGVLTSSAGWGDYTNDGRLDILFTGMSNADTPVAQIWANNRAPLIETGGPYVVEAATGPVTVTLNASQSVDPDKDPITFLWSTPQPGVSFTDSTSANSSLELTGLPVGTTFTLLLHVSDGLVTAQASTTVTVTTATPHFSHIQTALHPVMDSGASWGDFDGDGDLDILVTGLNFGPITYLARNEGNSLFVAFDAILPEVGVSSVAWGDYDNDLDIDILLTGQTDGMGFISRIYRNDGNGVLTNIPAGLVGVGFGSATWGDYDVDGDLDILLAGYTGNGAVSLVYRNDGQDTFVNINAGFTGVADCDAAWADYDGDDDLDALIAGSDSSGNPTSRIYRNDGNDTFTDIDAKIVNVSQAGVSWGDYDNDGDPDVVLTGIDAQGNSVSHIYRNDELDTFTNIHAGLRGVFASSVAWGDFDNDGDLDLLLTGNTGLFPVSSVYRNNGDGTFTDILADLVGVDHSSVDWGDFDGDGFLDILLTGRTANGNPVSRVYRNDLGPNHAPIAIPGGPYTVGPSVGLPTQLLDGSSSFDPDGHPITFHWSTDQSGVAFNDPAIATPILEFLGVFAGVTIEVTLAVSDGSETSVATTTVTVPVVLVDTNDDGVVNAIDVQIVVNSILGMPIDATDTDVNNDGKTDAVDLQSVVNGVLGAFGLG